ncbi:AGE family epimerase/isomerase [Zavarzinia sp.]|uniref:AGE family epimerase/isomerase n=1 Tax=Zavarzinia sp. TaxID=2027920 RepID=UPI003BB4E8C9
MTSGITALEREFALLRSWLFEEALPLWTDRGLDRANGGFFEKLNTDGTPTIEPRRARVIGRQIYVFAIAGKLGWTGPADEMMRYALDRLFRCHLGVDGMVISTVTAEGAPLNAGFDLYDHAFVLFGLAAAAARGKETAGFAARAARLRDDMKAGWGHPLAGFEESNPRSLPLKANPHMHMLEASLAWMAVSDDPAWGALADEIAELCLARFLDPATGALREYFGGEWQLLNQPDYGVVEPGHQFEWSWLLRRWGHWRGRADALAAAGRLAEIGEAPGVCPVRHLAMNELNPDLSLRDGLCRLWPQTERIKSHVLAMALSSDGEDRAAFALQAAQAASGLRRFFDHPLKGAWWEHLGIDGKPLAEPARTSSLYHIICAINEIADRLAAVQARP